jgi:hypothetical protein
MRKVLTPLWLVWMLTALSGLFVAATAVAMWNFSAYH